MRFRDKLRKIIAKSIGMELSPFKLDYRNKPSIYEMLKCIREYRDLVSSPIYSLEKSDMTLLQLSDKFKRVNKINYENYHKTPDIWFMNFLKGKEYNKKVIFVSPDIYPEKIKKVVSDYPEYGLSHISRSRNVLSALPIRHDIQHIDNSIGFNTFGKIHDNPSTRKNIVNYVRWEGYRSHRKEYLPMINTFENFSLGGSKIRPLSEGYMYYGSTIPIVRYSTWQQYKRLPSIISKKNNAAINSQLLQLREFGLNRKRFVDLTKDRRAEI